MEIINGGPLYRCTVRDGRPVEIVGEDHHHGGEPGFKGLVRLPGQSEYTAVLKLSTTSHRVYFTAGPETLSIRMDSVMSALCRGGLLKPKKLVLMLAHGGRSHELSVRIEDRVQFDVMVEAISRAISAKAWLRTGGFTFKAAIGGIGRLIAQMENSANKQAALMDAGMSDLESLKSNAKELINLISRMKRGTNADEISQIDSLLKEYGLLGESQTAMAPTVRTSALAPLVLPAISAANGVILVHDLFCLVNRKLKLEKLYAPKEFMEELRAMSNVHVLTVCHYNLVVNINEKDLNSTVVALLESKHAKMNLSDLAASLRIGNQFVLNLLLLKVEELFGCIVRDADPLGQTEWYLNPW